MSRWRAIRVTIDPCLTRGTPPSITRGATIRAASPAAKAGPKHARLTFLGHSTVLIEVDDLRILTDPMLRDGLGPVRRQVRGRPPGAVR